MAPKRKYLPEEDFSSSGNGANGQTGVKRSRRQETNSPTISTRSDGQGHSRGSTDQDRFPKSRTKRAKPPKESTTSRTGIRQAKLAAELANLADYNAPPIPRPGEVESDNDDNVRPRRTRTQKPLPALATSEPYSRRAVRPAKDVTRGKCLLDEIAELRPWPHWDSDEGSSDDSDTNDGLIPRSHADIYPPKQVGVQNIPWSSIPGELRNKIYEYCKSNEEEKVLNVHHYPNGVPRRSFRGVTQTTNFSYSYWGFTQTCRQVREEFVPWLLEKRKVRTPLATLNDYVDTFPRPDPVSGKRIGWVEPIFCGARLSNKGVEIMELLKHHYNDPGFHLQLRPTGMNPVHKALEQESNPRLNYDELKIFRLLKLFYKRSEGKDLHRRPWGIERALSEVGIKAIYITSDPLPIDQDDEENEMDGRSRKIMLRLQIAPLSGERSLEEQISLVSHLIFQSRLVQHPGITLTASIGDASVCWMTHPMDNVDFAWMDKTKEDDKQLVHRWKGKGFNRHGMYRIKKEDIPVSEFRSSSYLNLKTLFSSDFEL
jgi:hypothetical protein